MNIDEKLTLLMAVEESGFNITESLKRLQVPSSTYYRWRAKYKKLGRQGLKDRKSAPKKQWKQLLQKKMIASLSWPISSLKNLVVK